MNAFTYLYGKGDESATVNKVAAWFRMRFQTQNNFLSMTEKKTGMIHSDRFSLFPVRQTQ